jgi:ketosteroid isomerase-like protein
VAHALADPLAEDMTKLNAQWDAAINGPNFDALLPMYTADAALMLVHLCRTGSNATLVVMPMALGNHDKEPFHHSNVLKISRRS